MNSYMESNLLIHLSRLGNPILQISLNDLREVVKDLYHEERKRTEEAICAHREHATLTRKQTAKMLGVSLSTLWQWAKSGYLTPVKIGTKVMYRPSDVEATLTKQQGGGEVNNSTQVLNKEINDVEKDFEFFKNL